MTGFESPTEKEEPLPSHFRTPSAEAILMEQTARRRTPNPASIKEKPAVSRSRRAQFEGFLDC
jgi:hypothetical protein